MEGARKVRGSISETIPLINMPLGGPLKACTGLLSLSLSLTHSLYTKVNDQSDSKFIRAQFANESIENIPLVSFSPDIYEFP